MGCGPCALALARANLGALLSRAVKGEDIGIVDSGSGAPDGTRTGFTSTVAAQDLAFQVPEPSTFPFAGTCGLLSAWQRSVRRRLEK